jgi:hypothetical protein
LFEGIGDGGADIVGNAEGVVEGSPDGSDEGAEEGALLELGLREGDVEGF